MLGNELRRLMPKEVREECVKVLIDNFARITSKKAEKGQPIQDEDMYLSNPDTRNLLAAFDMLDNLSDGDDEYHVFTRTVRAIIRAHEGLSGLMIRNGLDMDYRVLDTAIDVNQAAFRCPDRESLLEQLRAMHSPVLDMVD